MSGLPIHGTIGAAVAAASPGETVVVCAGDYFENVTVNQADLTLQAQGVVRLGPGNTGSSGIAVTADGITIQGFDISGFTRPLACGVIVQANRSDIRDNSTHGNFWGICLDGGTEHRVRYNVTHDNGIGILNSRNFGPVELSSNTVESDVYGIYAQNCAPGVAIDHNAITGNVVGITVGPANFQPCDGVVITSNTVRGPGVSTNSYGIQVHDSEGVVLTRNLVQNTGTGVVLLEATGATASFNSISFNGIGLDLLSTTGATVTRNNVSRSTRVDCRADPLTVASSALSGNSCGTEQPAGAFR